MNTKEGFIIGCVIIAVAGIGYWIGIRKNDKSKDLIISEQQLINSKINDSIKTVEHKKVVDSMKIRSDSFEKAYNNISKFKNKIIYEVNYNTKRINNANDSLVNYIIDSIRSSGGV